MIEVVKMGEIIASARHDLGLPAGTKVDSAYWFAGLRRLAGQLCPCSPRTLVSSMAGSHRALDVVLDQPATERTFPDTAMLGLDLDASPLDRRAAIEALIPAGADRDVREKLLAFSVFD